MKKKIVVPEGMLKAARETDLPGSLMMILEAALRWLSENPIEPTADQAQEIWDYVPRGESFRRDIFAEWDYVPRGESFRRDIFAEWQRRMFLAPEPLEPEAVKDLTCTPEQLATLDGVNKEIAIRANNAIAEAYRRGLKGAK